MFGWVGGREGGPLLEWLQQLRRKRKATAAAILSCGLDQLAPGALPRRQSGAHRTWTVQGQGAQGKSPMRRRVPAGYMQLDVVLDGGKGQTVDLSVGWRDCNSTAWNLLRYRSEYLVGRGELFHFTPCVYEALHGSGDAPLSRPAVRQAAKPVNCAAAMQHLLPVWAHVSGGQQEAAADPAGAAGHLAGGAAVVAQAGEIAKTAAGGDRQGQLWCCQHM